MEGYGSNEVARMLGLSVQRVRSFVRAGFLEPQRGPRNELRFTFHDLVMLRTRTLWATNASTRASAASSDSVASVR